MQKSPPVISKKSSERAARTERLAQALRANLRRRKDQARGLEKPAAEGDARKPPT
jgi:hypothetical protein